jgi:cell division septal protein FtsQ
MWFRNKKRKNRRLHSDFVLDVKQRADVARARRARFSAKLLALTAGTFLGFYLLWRGCGVVLDVLVYDNPDFAVQRIDVQTDGKISAEIVRQKSGVQTGLNLFRVNLRTVKKNLESIALIESVSVERVLPGELKIRVTEREPLVQVNVPCGMAGGVPMLAVYQIDTTGKVIVPLDPREAKIPSTRIETTLPVITGNNAMAAVATNSIDSEKFPNVIAAVRLVEAFGKSPMFGLVDLRRVDVSAPGVLVVTTGQGGQITFAQNNFDQKLRRWREIYEYGRSANKGDIASVDLAVTNNVPVRWMLTSANPLPPPLLVKPKPSQSKPTQPSQKYRRRNV